MQNVFRNKDAIIEVGAGRLPALKDAARQSKLKRARLCLHLDDQDKVHEMVIVLCKDTYLRPHRHIGKSESFHMIEGELAVVFFSDDGQPTRRIHMGPIGGYHTFLYRLSSETWHTVIPLTEYAVIHETTSGPFAKGDAEYATWSPEESDAAGIRSFLADLASDYE